VNQSSTLDFTLTVGAVDTVVQVQAVGNQIEASSTELALTLESKQIADLPLDSRTLPNCSSRRPVFRLLLSGAARP